MKAKHVKAMVHYKVMRKHIKGCSAVRQVTNKTWPTPWSCFNDKVVYLDWAGRRNAKARGQRWRVVSCNCTSCSAYAVVREDSIIRNIP